MPPLKIVSLALVAFITPSAISFAWLASTGTVARRRFTQLYYTDDDDNRDHNSGSNNDRSSAITTGTWKTSSLQHMSPKLTLMDIEEDWKEWHYSFSRNGFTDFLPQFSSHLSCLVVGGEDGGEHGRLPWQEEAQSSITNFRLDTGSYPDPAPIVEQKRGELVSQAAVVRDEEEKENQNKLVPIEAEGAVTQRKITETRCNDQGYDCILDKGLMNTFLSSLSSSQGNLSPAGEQKLDDHAAVLQALMQEASRSVREHGIYVAVTDQMIPEHAKEHLAAIGEAVGMDWKFNLDGISSHEKGISVSVARRYFTGELPSFGKLATTTAPNDDLDSDSTKIPLLKP